ncbi:MAG: glycosyltransferase [Actinomycetota bacterium]|nr:glycosyltransferase [Actinomycetota bacterium]
MLETIGNSLIYKVILFFFAVYPIFFSLIWIITSIIYYFRRERGGRADFYRIDEHPMVSVFIPCHYEDRNIAATVERALGLDYPNFEVIVIDDGSRDRTWQQAERYIKHPRFRFVRKAYNEGKAMAINDVVPLANGEIILIIDADALVHTDFLTYIVPHFVKLPRMAAITGNPRVINTERLITKIQAIEFSSIIAILRRAQTVWGRILTVSGVVSAFRKSALLDVGLFDPEMATEDIAVSWKLQKRFYDVRYEPRAIADMQVPADLSGLWRQRRRWAKGLVQVLRKNVDIWRRYRFRRLWAVYTEAALSIFWAYCLVVLTIFWVISYSLGYKPLGAAPIPSWWGMLIATFSILQLGTGVLLARPYDRRISRFFLWSVLYPIGYWIYMSLITVAATPSGLFFKSAEPTRWRSVRK